jgi:hypothetical protein
VVAESTGTFYGQAMTAGDIYTVAGGGTGKAGFFGDGGPGAQAQLDQPNYVTEDGANLLVTDRYSNRIRMITG